MIVKCIASHPSEAQIQSLGPGFRRNREFGIVIGREYLVLGLTVNVISHTMGNGVWVIVLMEPDIPTLISAPLCLFEIVHPGVSRYWEFRISDEESITLWPPCFYRKSFLEDVSDRVPEAGQEFWRVHALIEAEAKQRIQAG
jgi:hypothetical protein